MSVLYSTLVLFTILLSCTTQFDLGPWETLHTTARWIFTVTAFLMPVLLEATDPVGKYLRMVSQFVLVTIGTYIITILAIGLLVSLVIIILVIFALILLVAIPFYCFDEVVNPDTFEGGVLSSIRSALDLED